jgi:hypothetical protein
MALARNKWGKSRPTIASRFLFELTGKADNPQAIAALQQARQTLRGGTGPVPPPRSGRPTKKKSAKGRNSRG